MIRIGIAPLLTLCLFSSAVAQQAAPATQPVRPPPDQISGRLGTPVQLFNGKDLTGWTWHSQAPVRIEEVWSVVDGNLHCKGKPAGYIMSADTFTNFVLKLEVRHIKAGNGGVLIRAVDEALPWPRSIECQGQAGALGDIWNIGNFPMKVDPDRTRGRNTRKLKPSNEKPLGEWNTYEIIMDGGNLRLYVNGELQNWAVECQEVAGKICLQSEGGEYEFRNITLTPIERH